MQETIKQTWIVFTISALAASLISFIPIQKMQSRYMSEFHRLKSEPQKRVDATLRYIDAIEDETPTTETYTYKTDIPSKKLAQKPYQKPIYVRDKNNPRILHRYHGN